MQKYGSILGRILERRGITTEDEADKFLNPDYGRDMHDPFLMRDMERACVRLYEAMEGGEKIVIYADYDCDGIPGAVILSDLLRKTGYTNFEIYIPERNSEGYGLNMGAIRELAGRGARLIITVDLGITAVEEVAQAAVDGIDIIITDHHIPPPVLPRAYAILNPKVDDYPEKMLCGAAVAWKLAYAFMKKYGERYVIKDGAEKWMLDMAGLATLADMVPLRGENRAIAYFGLKVLKKSPRAGLKKLLEKMNIDQAHLTEDDVTFMVAPRLNAASRMDSPVRAYELLAATDARQAGELAEHLTRINDERKLIVASIMKEVKKKIGARPERGVIVVGNPAWRVGVLGLVAGKICDEYHKPAFAWGRDENGMIKGSCRSDGSVSVVELMGDARDSFAEFGGHEQAGGFTADPDKIHFLEETLATSYEKLKRAVDEGAQSADVSGMLDLVSMRNWRFLEQLAPFGLENPKPVFLFERVSVGRVRQFGKNGSGEHLEVNFTDPDGNECKAVSFFSGPESFSASLTSGSPVNLLATFDCSYFRGRQELRLRVVDIL